MGRPELPQPGDVVDERYRIDHRIGRGGMGAVYAARDLLLDAAVAIKVLLPERSTDTVMAKRFLREARAAMAIRSEHVARVFEVGVLPSGLLYMVLELLVGRSLRQVVRKRAPLPEAEAVDYLIQTCHGMAAAHRAGVVHRDLKPSNLFLVGAESGEGVVKVLDFGVAKALGSVDDRKDWESLTETGHSVGTVKYASPEQLRCSKAVDERTDIWALGLILYAMLSGKAAFEAPNAGLLGAAILADDPIPLRERRAGIEPALETVVSRCLQKEPEDRFGSMDELAAALEPFRAASGSPPVSSSSSSSSSSSGPSRATGDAAADPSVAGPAATSRDDMAEDTAPTRQLAFAPAEEATRPWQRSAERTHGTARRAVLPVRSVVLVVFALVAFLVGWLVLR